LRETVLGAPQRREAQNLAERFRKHGIRGHSPISLLGPTAGLAAEQAAVEPRLQFAQELALPQGATNVRLTAKGQQFLVLLSLAQILPPVADHLFQATVPLESGDIH
jgi:hypothetical protein